MTSLYRSIGETKHKYEDLTREEKIKVTSCYKHRYPDNFCSRCRFYCICKDK